MVQAQEQEHGENAVAFVQDPARAATYDGPMNITGTFAITMTPEPGAEVVDGITIGRVRFDKVFAGPLTATSVVQMTSARTTIANSAGYVAIERIAGTVEGKAGSFVVMHTGVMDRGAQSLTISIVPDSGTGELAGIVGTMGIQIVEGVHHYTLDYTLPG